MRAAAWIVLGALTFTCHNGFTEEKKEETEKSEQLLPIYYMDDFQCSDGCDWDPCCMPYGLNPPLVCPTWNCCDWVGTLEYLYWKPFVENAHVTQVLEAHNFRFDSDTGAYTSGKLTNRPKDYKFEWDGGFRVGLGYNFPCDKWGIALIWTHYQTEFSSLFQGSGCTQGSEGIDAAVPAPYFLVGDLLRPFLYATSARLESKWNFQFNQIDLDFFRDFYVGCSLSLRPYAGLRAIFVKQKIKSCAEYTFPDNGIVAFFRDIKVNQRLMSEFKGVGINGGMKSNWEFFCGLSLYGDIGLSAIYSAYTTDAQLDYLGLPLDAGEKSALSTSVPYDFELLKVFADFALGIEWREPFNCCQNVFHLRLGWEHHMLFKASYFNSIANDQLLYDQTFSGVTQPPTGARFATSDGDISLYGFVFAIGVSF